MDIQKSIKEVKAIKVCVIAMPAHLDTMTVFLPELGTVCPTKIATDCIKDEGCAGHCLMI
jgi:hypothetical protein